LRRSITETEQLSTTLLPFNAIISLFLMSLGAGVIGGSCRRGCLPLRWPSEECSNAQNSMPHLTHPMIHILDEFLKAEDEHGFQNPRNLHNGVSSDKADE